MIDAEKSLSDIQEEVMIIFLNLRKVTSARLH